MSTRSDEILDVNGLLYEFRMARFELHQILLLLSGQKSSLRFLSTEERKQRADVLRSQHAGVGEDALPEQLKDRLFILESPACCAYEVVAQDLKYTDSNSHET